MLKKLFCVAKILLSLAKKTKWSTMTPYGHRKIEKTTFTFKNEFLQK